MCRKMKTKRFAIGLALALALAATAPQALAGPTFDTADVGGAVYGWLVELWSSLGSVIVASPNDKATTESDELGPMIIPNGPADEFSGPMVIPNGIEDSEGPTDESSGPMIIPNG